MDRLRQMDSVQKAAIKITKYLSFNKYWSDKTATSLPCSNIKTNGLKQSVLEHNFVPRPARGLLGLKPVKWRQNREVVPILNEVQMSKLTFPSTEHLVHYKYTDPRVVLKAEGPNAGLIPLSLSGPNVKVPTDVGFTQVNTKVYSYLLQKAYSRMSSAEFDFGVTVGEVAETAAFLAAPLYRLAALSSAAFAGLGMIRSQGLITVARIAHDVSRSQVRRLMHVTREHPLDSSLRILDESANHWLAYKFGVLPVIDDVAKVMEFKENNIRRLTGLQVARVRSKVIDDTVVDLAKDVPFTPSWWISYFATARTLDQYHLGLYFRNRITAPIVNFVENLGFAPWQLPSLAWELIPLSFVVDRFIDVKSFVRGNIGSLTKETYGSFCTRKIETTYSATVHKLCYASPYWPLVPDSGMSSVVKYEQMARAVNLSRPNFPVINPRWRDELTADATNLSLIWGRLRTFVSKAL